MKTIEDVTKLATENLHLKQISLRESNLQVNTDYQFSIEKWSHDIHVRQIAKSPFDLRVVNEGKEPIYIFGYKIGTRVILRQDSNEDEVVIFSFEAIFDALYLSKKELDDDFLDIFHEKHVCYHVLPYWRELLQSTTSRASLPTLSVPFYNILQ